MANYGGDSWYSSAGGGAVGQPDTRTSNMDAWGSYDYDGSNTQQHSEMTGGNYYAQQQPQTFDQYGGSMFIPGQQTAAGMGDVNFEDEPPLLEELGINFDHIRLKTFAVLNPLGSASAEVIADQDLAGPLVFCMLFGGALLLHGKVQFGYIYGIGVLGCLGMYALMNLMTAGGISLTCTVSILGYCLLPMSLLSLLAAVLSFQGVVGYVIAGMAVLWCSSSASKLFVTTLAMDSQRLLVAYPCGIVYGVFALLAIF